MKLIFTAGLLMLSLAACKDRESDPNKLPDATQTGANTGGALLNGEVWVAKRENIGPYVGGLANLYIPENGYTVRIFLRPNDDRGCIWINLESDHDFTTTTYILNDRKRNYGKYVIA